jgi:hypothetical protein
VVGGGRLVLSSEGGSMLVRSCLIQGLVGGSHGSDESLLLSTHGSGGGLSRGRCVIHVPLGGGGGNRGGGGLLPINHGEVGVAA